MAVKNGKNSIRVKFDFPFIRRYITMEVFNCTTLYELQACFSRFLNYDLTGCKLSFEHQAQRMNIFQTIKENLKDLGFAFAVDDQIRINVTIDDSKEMARRA